ncbi:MAG: O-antigen ligase family protein [Kiritimatiellia bacterium]
MAVSAVGKNTLTQLLVGLTAVAAAFLLAMLGTGTDITVIAAVVVFFLATAVSFTRGTEGLYLVIFAMLFSPEVFSGLETGRTTGEGGSGVVLRLEDIIMFAVVLGWILRSAYGGRRFGIVKTPVNAPIWIYMGISVTATLLGLFRGSVDSFSAGLFHNLKYFEYFLLFFMILAHVRRKEVVVHMILAMLIVFFLAMIYGYTQIGTGQRVNAPFDTEPNTFGGYIVLMMCVAGGIALEDTRAKVRVPLTGLLIFALPPLLFTLSRASYLALIAGFVAFAFVSRHRVIIISTAVTLVCITLLGLPVLPEQVQERVAGTFEPERQYHVEIAGVDFDASSSARLLSYEEAVQDWISRPLFGYGVTGTYFIDGQYPRLLVETGIAGLAAFLFMLWRLLTAVKKTALITPDRYLKGAANGFFCGIIAMMAHASSANTFMIIRIAEPFWLLAALILLIPQLEKEAPTETPASETNDE